MQILEHLKIIRAGGVAAVDELDQQGVVAGRFEVAVDQVIPTLTVGVADLGVAVAGQIHKIAVIHRIKVDGGRFARRAGDAGQILAAAQLVDQAGLAHVGPARKAQFRAVTFGQLAGNAVTGDKVRFVIVHRVAPLSTDRTGLGLLCGLRLGSRVHRLFCLFAGVRMAGGNGFGFEQRGVQHLRQIGHGQELEVLLHLVVHLIQIGDVVLRDEDGLHPLTVSSHALFAQTADGQHVAVQGDLAGHGDIAAHRDAGQAGHQRRGQGDTGGGAVLRHCAFGGVDVQVALFQALRVDAVLIRMDADIGDGKLGAFLHHVAQRTGDRDLAAAVVHDLHLNGQGLAAHAGPCQTVGDADGIGAVEEVGFDHLGAQQLFQIGTGDGEAFHLAGSDLAGTLAQHAGDGTLQVADAGFAHIAVDDAVQRTLGKGDLAAQAACLELLGHQMLAGDVVLFHAGVAGQLDDIHTVPQRAGDGAEVVGRGDEEHMAQVKRHINEVVVEGSVLLRVQRFQQSGSRVAPEIARQLIDLVQQHQRVRALGRDHRADDLARHGTDIGAAVAADLGFIPHAAKAQADILAAQAFGDGACNAGLADARRANEADDLALDVRGKFPDGQHLKDAVFDLFQAVVVAVKDALGLGDVEVVLGEGVPRQLQTGIQISADDRALLIAALHLGKAVHFLEQLLLTVGIQMQIGDPAAVLLGFGGGVVVLAQFLADHVHLLVQVVVALVFVHGFIDLLGDFLVDLQHPALPVHPLHKKAQTADQSPLFQHGLFVLKAEQKVCRDVLAEEGGVVVGIDREHHILADAGVQAEQLVEALFHVAEQRIRLGLFFGLHGAHRRGAHRGQQEAAVGVDLGELGAVFALHKDADEVIRHPHDLLDLSYDTVMIQAVGGGVVGLHVLLGNEEDVGMIADRPLHRGNAFFAAHFKVKQVVGENHKPPQGNGGQMENVPLHPDRNFFRHMQNLLFSTMFVGVVTETTQCGQDGAEGNGRQCAHRKPQHQHDRRVVKGDGGGKDHAGSQKLTDVMGQCTADRQDIPCWPHREMIIQQPHHQKREQTAAQREEPRRPAGHQKNEERLEDIQHQRLFRPHKKQGVHHHNIRQPQLHARQKAGDDEGALDERERHRQRKQQPGKGDAVGLGVVAAVLWHVGCSFGRYSSAAPCSYCSCSSMAFSHAANSSS